MKDGFVEYLQTLGLGSSISVSGVESHYNSALKLCPEPIDDIFISNYYKEDKSRDFESLFFFSKSFLMEVRSFRQDAIQDIDVARLVDSLTYYRIDAKNYVFGQAPSDKSRLLLHATTGDAIVFELKASAENCAKLALLFEKYVKSNWG